MNQSRTARMIAAVVAGALLGGCALGPDYTRPAVVKPPTFRGQATAEATSFADAPWWDVFHDPALQALIAEALRNNYDVGIAAEVVNDKGLPAKAGVESQVRLAVLMNPEQANSLGDVHGGVIMKLVDGSLVRGKINLHHDEHMIQRVSEIFTQVKDPFLVVFDATFEGKSGCVMVINKRNIIWASPGDD